MIEMSSPPEAIDKIVARIAKVYAGWTRASTMAQMRADWDAFFPTDAAPAEVSVVDAGGVDARWISAPGVDARRVLVYFHGGGFKIGSACSHQDLMSRLSQAASCRVLGVNFRLMPEHRYPAPLEDACAVYDWLLGQGIGASNIALAGDSAGGGMVASALIALRDRGTALPAAGVMLSALTDLTASGESYETRARADPIHQRPMILALGRMYVGKEGDPSDPLASPLFADLRGLPPLLLHVGDRETGLDDSRQFAERARAAGVTTQLDTWEGMIHVFQQFPDELVEARLSIEAIGRFLKDRWSSV